MKCTAVDLKFPFSLQRWLSRSEDRGSWGEGIAAQHLVREVGLRLVARNWRSSKDRRLELDLVCEDGEVLVFVEVKTRPFYASVRGLHAIHRRKKRALQQAVLAYLQELGAGRRPRALRLDVVEVVYGLKANPVVYHLANVPLLSSYRA